MKNLAAIDRDITRHCMRNYKVKLPAAMVLEKRLNGYRSEAIEKRIQKSLHKGR
jgi:hypothetical protein